MKKITESQVFKILTEIALMDYVEPCCNERYLHHFFTEKIQKDYPIVYEDITKTTLHPEWATTGKYKKEKNKKEYLIDKSGTSGHIDFVLGNYNNPDLGIEFKHIESWNIQSIVFDYMKLLDSQNNIKSAISFTIIYREKELSNRLTKREIDKSIDELKKRMEEKNRLAMDIPFLFWIIEIAPNSQEKKRNSWICDNIECGFKIKPV